MIYYTQGMDQLTRLNAATLATVVDEVAGLTCGDPVELIDQVRQLERLKNAAAGALDGGTAAGPGS